MIRSLYTAASAMLFGMSQQDVAADNLANTRTAGYKGLTSAGGAFKGVLARRINADRSPFPMGSEQVLGRIGTGVYQAVRGNDFADGAQRNTQAPLDFALTGDGFFVIETPEGVQYTRDGHFGRDLNDRLVTAQGMPVLGVDGQPIVVDTDHVIVKPDGKIYRNDELVGQFQIRSIDARFALRAGSSRFSLTDGAAAREVTPGADVTITQGMIEEANVDAARVASQLLSTSRSFEASQRVFTTINETLEAAVAQVGRVG